jgi:hypothetical protein
MTAVSRALLTGIAALLLATGTAPADITGGRNNPYSDGSIMYIDIIGDIKPGDDAIFRRLINTKDYVFVRLNSGGGDLAAGLSIGEQVRAHGKDTTTLVFAESRCASVCGLIWLAGNFRYAYEGAKIGFHSAYYASNGKVTAEGNALVGAYLSRLGFSNAAITYLTSAPPDSMQWLSCEALDRYNIEAYILSNKGNHYPCMEEFEARHRKKG